MPKLQVCLVHFDFSLSNGHLFKTLLKKSVNKKLLKETSHYPGTQERFAIQYPMTIVRPQDAFSNVFHFYDSKQTGL